MDAESNAGVIPVLTIDDLSVQFEKSPVTVLDHVSFTIAPGKTLALVGESGCGKSVTSLTLLGLAPRQARQLSGRIEFAGVDLGALSDRQKADIRGRDMAMIFQEPMTSLNPAFTIGDQLEEAVLRHHQVSKAQARQTALAILQKVQIPAAEKRLKAYPHQLSGGMRQRVMIAMALINRPKLLVADEPTTALDVTIQAQILSLLNELQNDLGSAILLITHDLGVVAEAADDVIVMYAGQIVEQGSVQAIFNDPQHPYTIGLMGAMPVMAKPGQKLSTIPGLVPAPEAMPSGCRFATRCPFADVRCHIDKPPLKAWTSQHRAACFKAPIELYVKEVG
ncbi:ABC transporter ATP-binding protein [Celerinatantimonas sp. YJH-8]|uniref:ABC transporter ATP-binding protein n=1 Tax=Celerinatantimonas sp. YJH-8 TaxID=3228714 RepID=UPI0038C04958